MRVSLLLGAAGLALAGPYPKDGLHDTGFSYLMPRNCASYCGDNNQFCCSKDESCTTLEGDVATCVGGNNYPDYTTTWTVTYTSTHYTHFVPAPDPTPGVDCIPQNNEWQPCGDICCAGWQTCAYSGQCSARPGYGSPTTVVMTNDGQVTTQYSAPYRVTGTTVFITSGVRTASATSTTSSATSTNSSDGDQDGGTANDGGGGGGLSGGAIAGIVIGTLAGIALLLLLCFCCIARGLWHAIFGRKKDREDRTEVTEERYSRHGGRVPSEYSRKDRHSGWFGGGRPSSAGGRREKKKHSGGFWLAMAGGAATLLALLNLRSSKKKAGRKPAQSRYSESYYSYDPSSPSSSSSGGRTHRTGRTRDSRASRPSYYNRGGGGSRR